MGRASKMPSSYLYDQ
ncbi:hypothetical protein [Escherichia coli]|nr:hypothetical protein [Escherichia coli]